MNQRLVVAAVWLVACGSPSANPDAATTDGASLEAGIDAGVCTLVPGDLPGERRIASAALSRT